LDGNTGCGKGSFFVIPSEARDLLFFPRSE
jgi:hypothetical protein